MLVGLEHSFERSLMDSLVVDSINPIEKLERTANILAAVVLDTPALLRPTVP